MAAPSEVKLIPVEDFYSRWVVDYDQGHLNTLQGIDESELATLLPKFLSLVLESHSAPDLKLIDFGCGTGRATLKLLNVPSATVIGLDATPSMLEIARRRCEERLASLPQDARAASVQCEVYNPLTHPAPPECAHNAVGLISTLVMCHFSTAEFLEATGKLLQSGAILLTTCTHADLARLTKASVPDKETGELLWAPNDLHPVEEMEQEAPKWGFELLSVQECIPKDPNLVGAMRGNWEGVKCWVGFLLRKK